MTKKAYELGILVGRFQVLHAGHEDMIKKALKVCDRVAVFVGSSQESGTEKNPFSCFFIVDLFVEIGEVLFLKTVFGSRLEVYPLPDAGIGNVAGWGEYVLQHVKADCGRLPDLMISGKEERRQSWFDGPVGAGIAELTVPKTIDISASRMREFFIADDRKSWKQYVNKKLIPLYGEMREIVLTSKDNTETKSI